MKLGVVIAGYEGVQEALGAVKSFEAGYALAELTKSLQIAVDMFGKEQQELIKKFGTEDPTTKEVFVRRETPEFGKYIEAINELLNKDLDISYKPLRKQDFDGQQISGVTVTKLMSFFTPPEKKE